MKRVSFLIFILAGVAVAAFLYTRQKRIASAKERETLVVLSRLWSPPHEKEFVINDIIRPFEKENNCTIDFQTLDDETLLKRARVQKETEHVVTDVVLVYVSKMREWVDNGYVTDLTQTVNSWSDRTFTKGFAEMTVFNGKQYFLPIGADNYLLCANTKALEYLPDGAEVSSLTWEQLADWSLRIAAGEGEGKFAFTGVAQKMLIYQLSAAILSYGGGFPDIASSQAVKAWNLFIKMRKSFSPTVRTYDSVVPPMKRGEAWLTVSHNARIGEIYSSNPTRFVIAPPPRGPAGMGSVAGVSGLAVPDGCPHPELAVKFLKYITSPEIQLKLAKGTGGFIPTVNETTALLGNTHQDEIIRNAILVLEKGRLQYIPAYKDWGSVKLIFDDAFNKLVLDDGRLDLAYLKIAQQRIDVLKSNIRGQ